FTMKNLITCFLLLISALSISAQEISFVYEKNVPVELKIDGKAEHTFWIGISFYPYGVKDGRTEGFHDFREIKLGRFAETFKIDKKFYGGTYEIAFWDKKINEKDCQTEDCLYWVKKRGFALDKMTFYKTGYFNGY
ncbi:hypothetical protein IT568_02360, partial [bacterium]|nr:hypothetical protein [bacterium]